MNRLFFRDRKHAPEISSEQSGQLLKQKNGRFRAPCAAVAGYVFARVPIKSRSGSSFSFAGAGVSCLAPPAAEEIPHGRFGRKKARRRATTLRGREIRLDFQMNRPI